jgi:hypothetical protein
MNNMSTRIQLAPSRARLAGFIASLFAVSAVLAGCSSSSDSDSGYDQSGAESAADVEYADAAAGADAAFAEGESAPEVKALTSTADRSVIITGSMYMTVEDPIVSADRAAGIVQNAGGRIDARSETAPDENYGGSAALTLRIPSDALDATVADLRELGTVDQFGTDSYDVTTEVTDLDAQISTLTASTERIEALLLEAKDITDIITLENELDRRQAELEGLEARQRGLDDQVSMSTITLSLTTEPVVIVDNDPDNFWDGLVSGWNGLVAFFSVALVVLGLLLPWLAVMALIALVVVAAVRTRQSRKARHAVAPATAAAPAAPPAAAHTNADGQPSTTNPGS